MKISWTVFKLQSRNDFVTDRQTDDLGKNNMSPNPKVGRQNYNCKMIYLNNQVVTDFYEESNI